MSPQLIRTLRALLFVVAGLVLVTSPFMKLGVEITNKNCAPAGDYCAATVKTLYPFKSTCTIRVTAQGTDLAGGPGPRHYMHRKACAEGATTTEWKENGVTMTAPEGPVTIPKADFRVAE